MFTKLISILDSHTKFNEIYFSYRMMHVFGALKRTQFKQIFKDTKMRAIVTRFMSRHVSICTQSISGPKSEMSGPFIHRARKYVPLRRVWSGDVDWNRVSAIVLKVLPRQSMFGSLRPYLFVKCGNIKCNIRYVEHKYGIKVPDVNGDGTADLTIQCEQWQNRKKSTENWYICNGCKTTYYCSRRCQKKSWNRYGHRRQCQKLQKLIVNEY